MGTDLPLGPSGSHELFFRGLSGRKRQLRWRCGVKRQETKTNSMMEKPRGGHPHTKLGRLKQLCLLIEAAPTGRACMCVREWGGDPDRLVSLRCPFKTTCWGTLKNTSPFGESTVDC